MFSNSSSLLAMQCATVDHFTQCKEKSVT